MRTFPLHLAFVLATLLAIVPPHAGASPVQELSAMRSENTFNLAAHGRAIARLQKPVGFLEGKACTRLRCKVVVPVKNTSGAPITLDNDQAVDIMRTVFGSITMAFGKRPREVVDNALPFDDFRFQTIGLTGRDVLFNGKQLYHYSDSDSDAVTIGAGETENVEVELVRPFIYSRLGADLDLHACGWTQMRQLDFFFYRAPGDFHADLEQDGSATCTMLFDEIPTDQDRWSNVPRVHRTSETGLTHKGPRGGILAVYETTKPAATTDLELFTLDGIHDTVLAADVSRKAQLQVPHGAIDLAEFVTVLYQPEEALHHDDIFTGEPSLRQHAAYLDPMNVTWLYVPEVSEDWTDQTVAPNAVDGKADDEQVKLVNAAVERGENVRPTIASITPPALLPVEHPRFDLLPGRVAQRNRTPAVHLPDAVKGAARARIAATKGREASATAQSVRSIAVAIPGATTSKEHEVTTMTRAVAEQVAPSTGIAQQAHSLLERLF